MLNSHPQSDGHAKAVGIVGGTGFIGTRITRCFEESGYRSRVFTLEDPLLDSSGTVADGVDQLDVLVWSASRNTPATASRFPQGATDEFDEVAATLRAVRSVRPDIHGVFMSSGGTVYGDSDRAHREDEELEPDSPYARLKVDLEGLFRDNLEVSTVLRVANAYGPGQGGQNAQGVLAHWLPAVHRGESVTIFGNPNAARDYVYVDDIAQAVVATVRLNELERTSHTFNVGSGVATSLEDLLMIVGRATGRDIEVSYLPTRGFDLLSSCLDIDSITSRTFWHPTTTLESGIGAMWDWECKRIAADSNTIL